MDEKKARWAVNFRDDIVPAAFLAPKADENQPDLFGEGIA